MPYEVQPPQITPADMPSEPLKTGEMTIQDNYALALVTQTYWGFEMFRTQNHDRRWSTHDSLYYGYVPPKVWDGTNVARAAFSQPIVFDQVEAALPAVTNALFGIAPEWFQVQGEPGTDAQEAKQIQDAISYVLEHPRDTLGSNSVAEFKLAIKQILLYGNGGVSVEWDPVANQPSITAVDIRDFYVDPGLCVPSVDEARSVIRRKFMTIDELLALKKDTRMTIPEVNVLWYMAKNVPQAPADETKRIQEALRGVYYSPGFSDFLPLPSDHKVEVLVYYSNSRIIWVLNKEWVAYNGPNPYGFIPFCFAPCYTVPGRFYAQSIGGVQEGNQRYIEALMNGHLDELTMLLHPPRVQKRSSLLTPAQQKWRPGAVFSGDNKDDVSLLQVGNNTVNVFEDINYLTVTSEKRTGINAMGQGSVPQPSNANRTLGGLQMQSGGSSARLSEIVSNIELYLLVPALYKLYKLMQFHTRPGQALPAADGQGDHYTVDASITQKKIQFRMLAASKMVTRDKLMQILPFWMQTLSQGNLMGELSKSGKTIDFDEFFRMIQDATGVSHLYNLVRPLTPQEQQAMQQEQQQNAQMEQQKAQQDGQTRQQIMQMKNQGDLQKVQAQGQIDMQKEQIKKAPSYWEQQMQKQQMDQEAQAKQQEMAMDQQQSQAELQQKKMLLAVQLQAKKEQAQMDLQKKHAEIQVGMHKANTDHQIAEMTHQQKMAQMLAQMQMDKAQGANTQSISDDFPATNTQPGMPNAAKSAPQSEKRPTKDGAGSKSKAKPPS